jgi:membrane protease subunit (stomatin/prohibitin family)
MNSAIVIEYIKKRMSELGHGDCYTLCLRHFIIASGGQVTIDAPNQLMVLIEPVEMVQVLSDNGLYDLSITYSNELQYEHTGSIKMQSYAGDRAIHVRFVQAIPN